VTDPPHRGVSNLNNHARVDVEATENPKRSGFAFRSSTTEKSFRPDDDLHTDDLAVNAKDKDEHYYDSDEHAAQVTISRISIPSETSEKFHPQILGKFLPKLYLGIMDNNIIF
jgi:hypothetical protein